MLDLWEQAESRRKGSETKVNLRRYSDSEPLPLAKSYGLKFPNSEKNDQALQTKNSAHEPVRDM